MLSCLGEGAISMRTVSCRPLHRNDAHAAAICPTVALRRLCGFAAASQQQLPPRGSDRRDAASPATTRGVALVASSSSTAALTVRAAGDPSTRSSSSGSTTTWDGPRRPRLFLDSPSINWDRWELLMFKRAHEAGIGAEGEEGEDEEGEDGAAAFAVRLADSDLNASYFRHWDDPAVHEPMLQDRALTTAWRDALAAAPPGALEGRVVLDVGCGLGLLSMLAAKAGAARVIAVDGSAGATDAARRIIKANGLEDKITVVHGSIEELEELPGGVAPGGVDVILSNWMGHGLLGGGMINSLATAVKRWLRPSGLVLPDRVSLWAAGLEDREALQEAKESWSRVAGLDMSAALVQVLKHPRRDTLTRKSQLLSSPLRLASWDTAELRPESVLKSEPIDDNADEEEDEEVEQEQYYARCPIRFTSLRDERLFGLVLWWDAVWTFGGALEGEGESPVRFSTHPLSASTHYQQLMLDLPRTVRLEADDEVVGELRVRPGGTDPRDIELDLRLEHRPAAAQQQQGTDDGANGGGASVSLQPITASYRVSHLGR